MNDVNMEDDVEVTDADVKKALESNLVQEELGGDQVESSTTEKLPAESTSEVVKTVTAEEKKTSEAVPYSRFKEIQEEKAKLQQELDSLRTQKTEVKQIQPDPDDLTEEEKLYFDEQQLKVIEKIGNKIRRQAERETIAQNQYWNDANANFKKASEKFPDLLKKDSAMWVKADKIVKEKYTQWSADKKTYYIPPNAQWLAALEANEEIREEKEKVEKASKEEKLNQKQNALVDTKGKRAPIAKVTTEDDADDMSPAELDRAMREDFQKRQEASD